MLSEVIRRSSRITKGLGLGESTGRIWTILLFSDRPLSQDEILKRSGNSLSLISNALSKLELIGALKVTKKNNKNMYTLKGDFISSYMYLFKNTFNKELEEIVKLLHNYEKKSKIIEEFLNDFKLLKEYMDIFVSLHKIRDISKIKKIKEVIKNEI